MPHFKIVSRWDSDKIIYEGEAESLKDLVETAVKVGASLDGASLVGARLDGARLVGARLVGASLDGASLDGASLDPIKSDFFMTLLHAIPAEVEFLKESIIGGRVDGSQYDGECACLKGTLEKCGRTVMAMGLKRDVREPAESFFLGIAQGDTPETNQISKIVLGWIEEFQSLIALQRQEVPA